MTKVICWIATQIKLFGVELADTFTAVGSDLLQLWQRYYVRVAGYVTLGLIVYLFMPVLFGAKMVVWDAAKNEGRHEALRYNYNAGPNALGLTIRLDNSEADYYQIFGHGPAEDLVHYFRRDEWITIRERMCERYISDNSGPMNEPYRIISVKDALEKLKADQLEDAKQRWGIAAIYEQRPVYEKTEGANWYIPPPKFDWTYLLVLVVAWFLKSTLVSALYFVPKLKFNGFSLKWEITTLRLPAAMLLFLVARKFYPWGDPRENVRRYVRVWCNLVGFAVLTVCSGGAAVLAKSVDTSKKKRGQTYAWVIKAEAKDASRSSDPPDAPLGSGSGTAIPEAAQPAWKFHVGVELDTAYLGADGSKFNTGYVFQPDGTASHKSGVYIDILHSKALSGQGLPTEVDTKVGINKTTHGFNWDVGLAEIAVTPMNRVRGDVWFLTTKLARPFKLSEKQSLTPSIGFWRAWPVKGQNPKGGSFWRFGLAHSWNFWKGLSLSSYIEPFRDSGAFGFKKGWLVRGSTQLDMRLSKRFTFSLPVLRFSAPIAVGDGRGPEHIFGIGFSYDF